MAEGIFYPDKCHLTLLEDCFFWGYRGNDCALIHVATERLELHKGMKIEVIFCDDSNGRFLIDDGQESNFVVVEESIDDFLIRVKHK